MRVISSDSSMDIFGQDARQGACQQGLAGAGWSHYQHVMFKRLSHFASIWSGVPESEGEARVAKLGLFER
jgi:hypothetical protein